MNKTFEAMNELKFIHIQLDSYFSDIHDEIFNSFHFIRHVDSIFLSKIKYTKKNLESHVTKVKLEFFHSFTCSTIFLFIYWWISSMAIISISLKKVSRWINACEYLKMFSLLALPLPTTIFTHSIVLQFVERRREWIIATELILTLPWIRPQSLTAFAFDCTLTIPSDEIFYQKYYLVN